MSLPRTCRAAVVAAYREPIEVREVQVPDRIEPGALIVRVDVASVCGSDVHLWEGTMADVSPIPLPVILGHEMMGTIVAMGEGTAKDSVGQPLKEGDRIIWTHESCGECYYCRVVQEPTCCSNRRAYMRENVATFPYLTGGFAEYCYVFPKSGRVRIPDSVKSEWASPAGCALRTVMHAFERAGRIEPHQHVIVQGSGPLGLYATALASYSGLKNVTVIGGPPARLELAKRYGATQTVSIEEFRDPKERVRQAKSFTTEGVGGDVVFEFSGAPYAVAEGLDLTRPAGRYVVIGQLGGPLTPVQAALIVRKHLTIYGTLSAHVGHFWKGLQFLEATRDRFDWDAMITNSYRLEELTDAIHAMQKYQEIKPLVLPWT
ncbi:MAG: zinc-binding dehydrogenase [Chloroflexi bacterium]|nr:zinc-binding dehydrogenase [Chloroflexota bacterium]